MTLESKLPKFGWMMVCSQASLSTRFSPCKKKKKKVQTGIRTFHSSHWFFWNVMLRLCRTNSMLVHLDIMVEILMLDTESKMHFSI